MSRLYILKAVVAAYPLSCPSPPSLSWPSRPLSRHVKEQSTARIRVARCTSFARERAPPSPPTHTHHSRSRLSHVTCRPARPVATRRTAPTPPPPQPPPPGTDRRAPWGCAARGQSRSSCGTGGGFLSRPVEQVPHLSLTHHSLIHHSPTRSRPRQCRLFRPVARRHPRRHLFARRPGRRRWQGRVCVAGRAFDRRGALPGWRLAVGDCRRVPCKGLSCIEAAAQGRRGAWGERRGRRRA